VRQIGSEALHAVAVVQDITERKRSEALLLASEERFRDVVDAAGEYIWETDAQWRIAFVSNQLERMMGYAPAEVIGRKTMEFLPEDEAARIEHLFRNRNNRAAPFNAIELQVLNSKGERVWQQISGVPVLDDKGHIIGYRGASLNIHDRKLAEQKIEQLATKDALTGLPNRVLLMDRLEQAIASASRKEQMLALMFIDLDRFKTINDSLGHHVGDLLLKTVADRLVGCVRRGDTLARLGGDEFIVALYDLKGAEDVTLVARKILANISLPCEIEGRLLSTGCSIGISIYPSDGADVQTLMRNADTAMYHAKEKGRNNYQYFSPEMNIRAVERLHLENELRLAVQNRQFTLHYQPQVHMHSNEIVGAEALVRWVHPMTGEHVPPARFITVAEDTGLIVPIGEWVLHTACSQAKAWQDAGHPDMRITVNVSVGQFRGNRSLIDSLEKVLAETGLEPRYLELEMTESLLFQNIEENVRLLSRIGEMGVRISIDDFGTGYSSLSYLKQLPVDTIKIDSSFVRDIVTDENDAAIIAAVIAMARRLKLGVIAEGVENLAQLNALRELQCDEYQGFYFSKPLPAEEFAQEFFSEPALSRIIGT
jgi:diguanylate cyclase (GGDEF)-like protein/PAS domain S-box-containing protein